jgi:predicted ATPase
MLFEDVQWSDPTSLELLDLIIDRVPALPLLLIVTFRPGRSSLLRGPAGRTSPRSVSIAWRGGSEPR